MKLSPKNKELIINILLIFVVPLIAYGLFLWNKSVTSEHFSNMECSVSTGSNLGELDFLHYAD